MSYDLVPQGDETSSVEETSEFRRTHFRVYDVDGFAGSFATTPPENATLKSVTAHVCAKFAGARGTGFASKDLVLMLGSRIVAVVLKGPDGQPRVTTFSPPE